jgi:hypothetical protein
MRVAPEGRGHDLFENRLNVIDRLAWCQTGAVADSEHMRVDREGFLPERGVEDDVGSLATDAREGLQLVAGARHFTAVIVDQRLAERDDILGLGIEQADGLDGVAQRLFAEFDHLAGRLDAREQRTTGDVDADVSRLRRENHRDQQLERIFGLELGRGRGVGLRQPPVEFENVAPLQALVSRARITSCIE